MANNHMYFSEIIYDINREQAKWIEAVLGFDYEEFEDGEAAKGALANLMGLETEELVSIDFEYWPGFAWGLHGTEEGSLWLHDNGESFGLDNLILFVQSLIKKWMPNYIFPMTWAGTCSKSRVGEFGGGWVVISKNRVEYEDTWSEVACELHTKGFYKPELLPRWRLEKLAFYLLEWCFFNYDKGEWDLDKGIGGADTVEAVCDFMEKCGLWPRSVEELEEGIGESRGDER